LPRSGSAEERPGRGAALLKSGPVAERPRLTGGRTGKPGRSGSIVRYVNVRQGSGARPGPDGAAGQGAGSGPAEDAWDPDLPGDGDGGAREGARRAADGDRPGGGRRTDFVQSLDRGLAVIRCFSSEHPSLTLSEVAERTGLTRAAARRFLLTLQELGYVGSSGRQFSLRPRVLALGYAYLSSFSVSQIAQPHLEDLAEELHESCSVSVLDGDDLVYVARASANRIMTIALTVGTRLPAYPTSMGRILLAHLPETELDAYLRRTTMRKLTEHTITDPGELRAVLATARSRGWTAVDQELEAGVRSIAVPIRDSSRKVVAAINASAHAARVPMRTLEKQFLPRLQGAARQIDSELAARL
jgi:IclR family transcriptional regulator, pca regulon regulatory protein